MLPPSESHNTHKCNDWRTFIFKKLAPNWQKSPKLASSSKKKTSVFSHQIGKNRPKKTNCSSPNLSQLRKKYLDFAMSGVCHTHLKQPLKQIGETPKITPRQLASFLAVQFLGSRFSHVNVSVMMDWLDPPMGHLSISLLSCACRLVQRSTKNINWINPMGSMGLVYLPTWKPWKWAKCR